MVTETHRGKVSPGFKVGFYGCTDQLVRVAYHYSGKGRMPQHFWVNCPACGNKHRVNTPLWRQAKSVEEFLLSHIELTQAQLEPHSG